MRVPTVTCERMEMVAKRVLQEFVAVKGSSGVSPIMKVSRGMSATIPQPLSSLSFRRRQCMSRGVGSTARLVEPLIGASTEIWRLASGHRGLSFHSWATL